MPPMKTDRSWLDEFRGRYAGWWPEARPMIERHDYAAAFKTYPWPAFAAAPWTPVTRPLAESRIGVVTTGGLYRAGVDAPFDCQAPEGDWSFRAIPAGVPIQTLGIAHAHFAHEVAEADMNTIFPLDRLRELEAAGLIGGVADVHFSTMGYCPRAADLAEETAPAIAAALQAAGADVALVVPV
jgi:D-proline reductase (dithiol) PrdB